MPNSCIERCVSGDFQAVTKRCPVGSKPKGSSRADTRCEQLVTSWRRGGKQRSRTEEMTRPSPLLLVRLSLQWLVFS